MLQNHKQWPHCSQETKNTNCATPICLTTPICCHLNSHMFSVYYWWQQKERMPNVYSAGEQEGLFKLLSLVLILSLTWVSTITILYLSQPLNDASWEANTYPNTPEASCLLQKPESTLLGPHQTLLGCYSEPDESNMHSYILFLYHPFKFHSVICMIVTWVVSVASSLKYSNQNFLKISCVLHLVACPILLNVLDLITNTILKLLDIITDIQVCAA